MKSIQIAITTSLFLFSQFATGARLDLLDDQQRNSSDTFGQTLMQRNVTDNVFTDILPSGSQIANRRLREDYLNAVKLLKNRQLGEAGKTIYRLLQENPDDAHVYTLRATLEVLNKEPELAIKSYQKAIDLAPKNIRAYLGLASVYLQSGNLSQAKNYTNSALAINDQSAPAYLLLAKIAYRQNKPHDVESILLTAQKYARGNSQMEIVIAGYLVEFYASQKQPEKALQLAQDITKRYPGDSSALALLASAQVFNKQAEQAIATLEKLIRQEKNDVPHRLLLAKLLVNQSGKQQQVRHLLDEANSLAPDDVQVQINRTLLLTQLKLFPDALQVAKKVKQLAPHTGMAEALEGKIYLTENKQNLALSAFQDSYAIKPNINILRVITKIMLSQGKQSDAINLLNQELESNPKNVAAHFDLGNIYLQQKNISKAQLHYEAILAEQPENIIVLNNLAWIYHQQNNPKAMQLAKRAYQKAPKSAVIADTYAMNLVQQGDLDKGLTILEKAAQQAPQNFDIQYHLAETYALNGQDKEAIQILKPIVSSEQNFHEKAAAISLLKKLD